MNLEYKQKNRLENTKLMAQVLITYVFYIKSTLLKFVCEEVDF